MHRPLGFAFSILVAICFSLRMGGCDRPAEATLARDEVTEYIAYRHAAGRGREAEVLVVWGDGLAVRCRRTEEGTIAWTGRASREAVAQVRARLPKVGESVAASKGVGGVPDGPVGTLVIRFGETQALLHWDEVVMPGWGANLNVSDQYLEMASIWIRTKILLAGLFPTDARESGPELTAEVRGRASVKNADELIDGWIRSPSRSGPFSDHAR